MADCSSHILGRANYSALVFGSSVPDGDDKVRMDWSDGGVEVFHHSLWPFELLELLQKVHTHFEVGQVTVLESASRSLLMSLSRTEGVVTVVVEEGPSGVGSCAEATASVSGWSHSVRPVPLSVQNNSRTHSVRWPGARLNGGMSVCGW